MSARSGRPRRGLAVWLWVLVSLAGGVGAVALGVVAIIQCSSLLGDVGYPGSFPTSPLGLRTITVMVLAIAALVLCGAMALTGLFALFGARWASLLFGAAVFVAFLTVAGQVLLSLPRTYTDAVSRYGVDHNGQPLEGLPTWGGLLVLFLLLASLALTRPVYRYALARSR